MIPPPPISTLFPYTTLFRSYRIGQLDHEEVLVMQYYYGSQMPLRVLDEAESWKKLELKHTDIRSEEHTSELQSRGHLVCRLLLEKKKPKIQLLYSRRRSQLS